MSSTVIHLLRHGETEGGPRYRGSTDDALTPRGWAQMWAAVGEIGWDRIVASPLVRCAAFAQTLAERRGIPLEIDARLREMHFGAWEGRTAVEIMAQDADALTRFWQDPAAYPPPDGEPLLAFQARVLQAWREIVRADAAQRVLLVSHGGPIRVVLCDIKQHPVERLLELEVAHAALLAVRVHGDGAALA
ncbi:MAG: histidine phosphatase family protein [Sulfurimicrobium sp.]|nr:histidine phosphatase family protein [Sulfurimicrobium sp.]